MMITLAFGFIPFPVYFKLMHKFCIPVGAFSLLEQSLAAKYKLPIFKLVYLTHCTELPIFEWENHFMALSYQYLKG